MPTLTQNETVASREHLFVSADIYNDPINCGDDRKSTIDKFIHMFGGVLFVSYTSAVMQEIEQPGSVENLPDLTQQVTNYLKSNGIKGIGVHSDVSAEHDSNLHTDKPDGPVGCGFAAKRGVISQLISENRDEIIEQASQLIPELFIEESAYSYAHQAADAHHRLSERAEKAIGDGRKLVLSACESGAETAVVTGEHVATDGIINTRHDTTFDTNTATAEGLPAYNHNLWASNALIEMLPSQPDRTQAAIASLIDIIGTMRALGVQNIAVR